MPDDLLFVESVTAGGHRLRVDFFKLSDRYGHRLSVVLRDESGRETMIPLAESVEGTSDDPWPPSPPLQSLSIERLSDRCTAALLVGIAGRSHWSASIEVKPEEPALGLIEFDFACRSAELPRSLSCEYRALPGVEVMLDPKIWLLLLRCQGVFIVMKGTLGCYQPEVIAEIQPRFRFVLPVEALKSEETCAGDTLPGWGVSITPASASALNARPISCRPTVPGHRLPLHCE
jgi:hypothetical protein